MNFTLVPADVPRPLLVNATKPNDRRPSFSNQDDQGFKLPGTMDDINSGGNASTSSNKATF